MQNDTLSIYAIAIVIARTNVPLSSARLLTSFIHPPQNEPKIYTQKSLSPKKEKNTILNENFQSIFIGG